MKNNVLKIVAFFFCFNLFCTASTAQTISPLQKKIQEASKAFNVAILYEKNIQDSQNGVTYDMPESASLISYLDLVEKEYAKYPSGYLSRTGIHTLVLTKNLKYNGQARAAVPDPSKGKLFLCVNGAYNVSSNRYLVHVMHHELHHCTEYALWKNMTYDWREWLILNSEGFKYGNGGASAYADAITKGIDVYSPTNPQKGFINLYSLTGDEEDRAELLAYILTDYERPLLITLLKKDEILLKKIEVLRKLLNTFTPEPLEFPELNIAVK